MSGKGVCEYFIVIGPYSVSWVSCSDNGDETFGSCGLHCCASIDSGCYPQYNGYSVNLGTF